MAKYLGNVLRVKVETTPGGGTFAAIGGASEESFTLSNGQVDVSDKDSSRWKELLSAGDRELSLSINGFVSNDANFAIVETAAEDDVILNYELEYGNGKTITGAFHIDSFEVSGARNNGQSFTLSLASSGAPIWS